MSSLNSLLDRNLYQCDLATKVSGRIRATPKPFVNGRSIRFGSFATLHLRANTRPPTIQLTPSSSTPKRRCRIPLLIILCDAGWLLFVKDFMKVPPHHIARMGNRFVILVVDDNPDLVLCPETRVGALHLTDERKTALKKMRALGPHEIARNPRTPCSRGIGGTGA